MMENVSKLGAFSVKHMTGTKADGSNYDFYSLEKRVFNKQKNEWESKDLILTPSDMAVVSAVCGEAARKTACEEALKVNRRLSEKRQGDAAAAPDEDVPF